MTPEGLDRFLADNLESRFYKGATIVFRDSQLGNVKIGTYTIESCQGGCGTALVVLVPEKTIW